MFIIEYWRLLAFVIGRILVYWEPLLFAVMRLVKIDVSPLQFFRIFLESGIQVDVAHHDVVHEVYLPDGALFQTVVIAQLIIILKPPDIPRLSFHLLNFLPHAIQIFLPLVVDEAVLISGGCQLLNR